MESTITSPAFEQAKFDAFMGKAVMDMGAAMHAALIVIGDKLGLYKAMAGAGPLTPAELAAKTKTTERYVREWLNANAASGYVTYDAATKKFELPPEQAFALTTVDLPGAFHIISSCFKDEPKITQAFRTGDGVGWHEHDANLFFGTERFFRPNYEQNLLSAWIPALEGMADKLARGATVADVGCGHGASTMLMAKAFPKSRFSGFDYHSGSIEYARHVAGRDGLLDQINFEVASSKSYPVNGGYDLVTFFDCLHDMGDPVGAARDVLSSLKPEGTWMIVEPFANDRPEQNHNPVGRIYYSASTMICTPASLAQEVGAALGAQDGEERIHDVVSQAGFKRFRRAAETPFNLVYEVRA
jgi:2-polyprenyl-3-methyl-5-hydroxy-6-metoxy-1,4-benzoquinol methylase